MAILIVKNIFRKLSVITGLIFVGLTFSCSSSKISSNDLQTDTIYTNRSKEGWPLQVIFTMGKSHNHPLMAIWTTDTNGNYIETLFIAKSIAQGVFGYGDKSSGKWMPGPIRRPAALPVWSHNRNVIEKDGLYIPTAENPMPDAITGATPPGNFVLNTATSSKDRTVFDVYFEINQSWDWNEFWTNNKYPDDEDYKTSCQPALVYKARIDIYRPPGNLDFELIGHSHFSGKTGRVYSDLSTITTARYISQSIKIQYNRQ